MTIRKNGAAWGSVVGIVFGIVGIGIPLPGTALAEWQWLHPVGFYTVSIVLLGSLGMVLGWLFDHLIRRSPHNVMLGVPLALALAVASVSLYRSQAALRQAFWQPPGVGLAEVTGIQGDLQRGRPARDYRQAGTLMGAIGADMAAPEQMAPSLGVFVNFNRLAVAFHQDGLKLARNPDAANVDAARKLCRTVLSLTEQDRVHDHAAGITPEVIAQVMQQMAQRLPSHDQYGWAQ